MTYQDQQYQLFNQLESAYQRGETPSNVYPKIKDYANDPRLCLTLANWIDPDLALSIDETLIQPLKAVDPRQFYYPQTSLHTTLLTLFLAADPPMFTASEVAVIKKVLEKVIPTLEPITYHLKGLFLMPNSIGLRGYTGSELYTAIKTIRTALEKEGIKINPGVASDEVYFGHITLCRFTTPPNSAFWHKTVELRNRSFGYKTVKCWDLLATNFAFASNSIQKFGKFTLQ